MSLGKLFVIFLFCLFSCLPLYTLAELKTWTGYGANGSWLNALNWSGNTIPVSTDDVLLDNADLPFSYKVLLPDLSVTIRTLRIKPSPGRNIELMLPATSLLPDAFIATGPGYGMELYAGAIFRNACGISSGESLHIADSIIIYNGGRYIHQTRAAHATSILKILSTAPGTEQGVFDFDVPRASYTISVSNRIYGSLELHSTAYGGPVNYTCSGANPLFVRGNLRISLAVNLSMNLNGANGNIQVVGDFIQEPGLLNLASVAGNNSILRVRGNLYQSPGATITETTNGNPFLELNGLRPQEIAMAGTMVNQVGFRLNNPSGVFLSSPLVLPFTMELVQGFLKSSASAMLILSPRSSVAVDSSSQNGAYIEGPVRKLGLNGQDHFLFPVGHDGVLRWLELKSASGNYTVEYFHDDPRKMIHAAGTGLDHISGVEYWKVAADGETGSEAKIELSFSVAQSGLVTDPAYLNIARLQSDAWEDGGHTAKTGNSIQGSVTGGTENFNATFFTLASTRNTENPLPVTKLELHLKAVYDQIIFDWDIETDEVPDSFAILEKKGSVYYSVAAIAAIPDLKSYSIVCSKTLSSGDHFFVLRMKDKSGKHYEGNTVLLTKSSNESRLALKTSPDKPAAMFLFQTDRADLLKYSIVSPNGSIIRQGSLAVKAGSNYFEPGLPANSRGIYILSAMNSAGKLFSLLFRNL